MAKRRVNKWSRLNARAERSELRIQAFQHSETGADGCLYQVQHVGGSEKEYTCPGCLHVVSPGTSHIVAWAQNAPFGRDIGVQARRHWHVNCWNRKLRPHD